MFLSLIDDPRIKDHLHGNWDAPSSPPSFDSGILDEIHSGVWHQSTMEKFITNDTNEILCCIILAIDRTHVANKDKLLLEPVYFHYLSSHVHYGIIPLRGDHSGSYPSSPLQNLLVSMLKPITESLVAFS
jgi:hypothetical protein